MPTTHAPKFEAIRAELNKTHLERSEIVTGMLVSLIGRQHLLMVGPGGVGKSFLCRDLASRIINPDNDRPMWDEYADEIEFNGYFETALDESTTPDQVHGPPDIKGMVEEGKTRRVVKGMLPEAIIAFLDEFFNASGVTLHSTMPVLNERLFHNNGVPSKVPLWTAFMGTNKLNTDVDQAALWDRVDLRYMVDYVMDRDARRAITAATVQRQKSDYQPEERSSIRLNEIFEAHDEAMDVHVPDTVWEAFLDLHDALVGEGVIPSTRRLPKGMTSVLAHAYLHGRDEVTIGDLSMLQHSWWLFQDQIPKVQEIILDVTAPGEKKALTLLADLDKLRDDLKEVEAADSARKNPVGIEVYKNAQKILQQAEKLMTQAQSAQSSTSRIELLQSRASSLLKEVAADVFGIDSEQIEKLSR